MGNLNNAKIFVGSIVTIYDFELEEENKYQIVEKKTSEGELSFNSVLGKTLLGRSSGERITVKAEGAYEIEIRKVDNANIKKMETFNNVFQKQSLQKTQSVQAMRQEKTYRNVYFCFQGKQFKNELLGGYIFAGLDPTISHWKRLKELKEGDVIFHGSMQGILAVSIVKGGYSIEKRPLAHYLANERKDYKGLYVQCKYLLLKHPIITQNYKKEIIEYQGDHSGKGYPFNKNGTGNQGYLFNMNMGLAKFFMKEIIKVNPYFKEEVFVKELLK